MTTTMFTYSILMSFMFMLADHPLSMGLILLIQTTLTAMITGMITGMMAPNFWFSYILFMIMVGGMLVLFIYMTSVASNEKFTLSNSMMISMSIWMMGTSAMMTLDKSLSYQMTMNQDTMSMLTQTQFFLSMSKYLNFPPNAWMILMIMYLLFTLIAVVKITNITYGPLWQKM